MGVVKAKRKESPMEVFHHAYRLRKDLTDVLLRDFGMVNTSVTDEQREYYQWFIVNERNAITNILRSLVGNLTMANAIFPTTIAECDERRIYQDRALGNLAVLMQELQYVITTLPVNVNKYTNFVEPIRRETNLIKGWRKSDNAIRKKIEKEKRNIESTEVVKDEGLGTT